MKCKHCGDQQRPFCSTHRTTKVKSILTGCCGAYLQPCPKPETLIKSDTLSTEEKDYLSRLIGLNWYSSQQVGILLSLETKAWEGMNHV
ncbi:MAG: hypothetical protein ACKPCI_18090 [Dolichospermum sp.]